MPPIPRINHLDATCLDSEDAQHLAAVIARAWPDDVETVDQKAGSLIEQWRGYDGRAEQKPHYLVIRDAAGERILGTGQVQPRTIATHERKLTILALARVCVDRPWQGEKFGAALVRMAFSLVDDGVFPFSLFQTTPDVRPFYEKLEACVADNQFVNSLSDRPDANPFWHEVAMRYPSSGDWPNGTIDLLGPGY